MGLQKQTKSCSLEQTQPLRTSTNRSVPCLYYFHFLSNKDGPSRTGAIPSAPSLISQSRLCGCLVSSRKLGPLEKARSHLRLPCSVKVGCEVVLFRGTVVSASKNSKSLKQARSHPYPACSVKLHSVIVLTNRKTFIPWHEDSDSRIEV